MSRTPTLRHNGEHMLTVRPRFDLDGHMVTVIVARQLWNDASDYGAAEPVDVSKREVDEAITTYLRSYGWSELDDWANNISIDEDEVARAYVWARDQVRRMYPRLTTPYSPYGE